MSSRWRYYNSKRGGNGFRGRGRGRGRGTSLTAISLPREDHLHNEFYKDKPMDPKEFRDETVLSISFGQNMLGAAYYEQSSHIVKIMNDISEDHEFEYLKRLIEDVKPTIILVNKSQDLNFIKLLSSRCEPAEKIDVDATNETMDSIPRWDSSIAYFADLTTTQELQEGEDEESGEPIAKLYKLPNNFFKMSRALERLKRLVGSDDASMSDENKYTIVAMRFDIEAVNMMRSLGALLLFLDETRIGVESEPLSVSSPIKSIKTLTLQDLVDIDFNTIQALDILPKESDKKKSAGHQKSLYSLIDRCRSTAGKKCLQKWFRNPTRDRNELVSRQKCVHFFKQDWNAEITAKIVSMLGKVKPLNNVFSRFQSGTAQLIHWEGFVSTVNAIVEIIGIIKQTLISTELPVEGELLRDVSEVAVITGSIINFAESKLQGRVTIMPGIDSELDKMREIYENMPMVLTAIARQEGDRLGLGQFKSVECFYVPLVGFILSLPKNYPIHSQPDMSLVYATNDDLRVRNSATERLENEFGDILLKLIDKQKAIILNLKAALMRKKRSINVLLSIVARIDALVSLGLVAAENGWNCPGLIDEPVIEAAELFHPISDLVVKKEFVPNQVSSGRKGVKVSIITGPNACGKSVYMKSIGVLAFLAHIGSFVPARHAKVGPIDRIVTRMFTVDSVLDGMSTFAKDVDQVALALRKATANSLVIIDEFGKGTMTEVGLSLLATCMGHWMQKGVDRCPHIFLCSHFHALPKYIPLETNIAKFLTFTVLREPGGKVKYLFQLTPGMVDCSFAMAVAKEAGIPMPVLGRACRIYKALKSGTPLKEVRAEVTNKDEELLVADMDFLLENGDTFMDAVESFVKRDLARSEKEEKSNSACGQKAEETEKELQRIEVVEKEKMKEKTRPISTALSSRTIASMDHLSMFNALLPLRKEKKQAQTPKKPDSSIRTGSPDPFTTDDEDDEGEDSSTKVVPMMRRLSSDGERKRIRSATSSSRSVLEPSLTNKIISDERAGIKRPQSPSSREESVYAKKDRTAESLFKTPIQRARAEETIIPVKSQKSSVQQRLTASSAAAMFETPSTVKRPPESRLSQRPPYLDQDGAGSRELKLDSMFAAPQSGSRNYPQKSESALRTPSSIDPNLPQRSSSGRERREYENLFPLSDSPETKFNLFSPIGSQFSIFHSQKSTSEFTQQNAILSGSNKRKEATELQLSECNVSGKKSGQSVVKDLSKDVNKSVFQTPQKIVSEKQKSFLVRKAQASLQSMSPSSVILGELTRETEQRTPLPRGDKPEGINFEFNPADDDPIYGKDGPTNSSIFDFLKSDDEDEEFLKSFMES